MLSAFRTHRAWFMQRAISGRGFSDPVCVYTPNSLTMLVCGHRVWVSQNLTNGKDTDNDCFRLSDCFTFLASSLFLVWKWAKGTNCLYEMTMWWMNKCDLFLQIFQFQSDLLIVGWSFFITIFIFTEKTAFVGVCNKHVFIHEEIFFCMPARASLQHNSTAFITVL